MISENQTKRIFIYIRVSTQEQAHEGYSIAAQEERLRAYAKARGYTIVKIFTDPAYSGANMERPALQEMVKGIEQGIADLVLVYKLDRLSRSQKDTLYLIEDVFLKNSVDFISMNESFDTSTPFGRAMVGILSVFAQLEREQIRERTMMGREQRAKAGKWHGGGGVDRTVTGYDYVDGELIINEYGTACVRFIFETYNKGVGLAKIYERVEEKYPGIISTETTVRNILKNPLYTAMIKHKGKLYEGEHEPIISDALFSQTQKLIEKRTSTSDPFRKQYILSGLIYCGICGARMYGRSGGKLKDGTPMRYYACYSRTGHRKHMVKDVECTKVSERKEPLENQIIEKIQALNEDTVNRGQDKDDYVLENIAILEKELFAIDKKVSKLMTLYSMDGIPMDLMAEEIKRLNADRSKIEEHIREEEEKLLLIDTDEIKEVVSQLSTFDWDEGETEEKRLIVAKLINKVIVSDDNITVDWAF